MSEDQSMISSNLRQELLALLSHPSIVGPDGVPPGASEFDIQTFERLHGLRLPPTLRPWFSVVNGALCGTQGFLGLNDYRVDSKYFRDGSWLPVADDGCRDYYLIDLTGPDQGDYPVFFGTMRPVRMLRAAH
jgi:cell wall assembly regulator SMI1